jgi:outer membrane protein
VLESVNKKVEAYGKAKGYKLILIAPPAAPLPTARKTSTSLRRAGDLNSELSIKKVAERQFALT